MDSVMMRSFDPTSSMFQSSAARNMTQIGFGAVRTQKEVAPQEEEQHNGIQDDVNISMPGATEELEADDAVENAAMSGALGEVVDDDQDDDEEIQERHNNVREEELERFLNGNDEQVSLNGVSKPQDVQRLNQMDDPDLAVRDILKDVPRTSLEPASNIVCNQVQNGRPAEALVALKPVEGVNAIDFQAAPQVGVLDIHDSGNKPMVEEPQDNMEASVKQNLAREQMDNLINNLPEDRKSMVTEMRNAVTAWASSNGVNADSAFAEKLHDLAQGWDDETLMAATGAFTAASNQMSAEEA